MTRGHVRPGVVLVAALATLALLAVLTAGALAATSRLREGSGLANADARLLAFGDFALGDVVLGWREREIAKLAVGATHRYDVSPLPPDGDPPVSVSVTRLTGGRFWSVATARLESGASRRLTRVLELRSVDPDSLGPVAAAGDVMVHDLAMVATDSTPVSGCALPTVMRVALPLTNALVNQLGAPTRPGLADPRPIPASSWGGVGGLAAPEVSSIADVRHPPGGAASFDPSHGVVFGEGALTITGGMGSGVLMVTGPLTLSGSAVFTGVIVASGGVTLESGATVIGFLRAGPGAGAVGGQALRVMGSASVRGSVCVAQAQLQSALPPRAAGARSWGELY